MIKDSCVMLVLLLVKLMGSCKTLKFVLFVDLMALHLKLCLCGLYFGLKID